MKKSILSLLFLIFIAGCSDEQLLNQNNDLNNQLKIIKKEQKEHKIEIDYAENQASIAAGCDFLVPICPENMTKVGHKAIAKGFAGSGAWFWAAFLLKIFALGAFFGGFVGCLWWLKNWLIKPMRDDIEEAYNLISTAQKRIDKANADYQKIINAEKMAQAQLFDLKTELKEAAILLKKVTESREEEEKTIENLKVITNSLRAFSK